MGGPPHDDKPSTDRDEDAADPNAETVAGPTTGRVDGAPYASDRGARTVATPVRIGRYDVIRLLGEGAMGRVYLARDPDLDRRVAIKTVRDDLPMPADARETFLTRFRNEARAAARVTHPGIVAVYDVGDDPKHGPFLVLEYVSGATLQERLASKGALAPDELVSLADRIAPAIDAAHAASIVHRDIKPQNVLVTAEGDAKLTDFGVARIPDAQLTREGQFLGTPCYAAPETLSDQEYSPASDLFSFGALLYEAATGKRAFPGDDAVAVARKVIDEEPVAPSKARRGLPETLDRTFARALAKDRTARPRTAVELASEMRRAFGGAPLRGGVGSTDRRESGGLAFAAVLVGSLVLGGAIVLALVRDRESADTGASVAVAPTRDAGADAAALDAATVLAVIDSGRTRPSAASSGAGSTSVTTPNEDEGADAGGAAAVDRPDASGLSRQEREDLAKDELDRVRARLRENDLDGARAALARARSLDPTHPDIEVLEASVRRADESTDP
ncbi:MAG: serine/threonine protein kinase [Deltaproteobacteria bacterium]|nr:serine/threonine protein kinase [Deltaproteobacteria bacterium]